MDSPSRFDTVNMEWAEIEIVSDFLARLALSLEHRGVMLDSNSLTRLAESLSPGKAVNLLTEPWMTPFKKTAQDVIPLGRIIVQQVLDEFGFDALADAGLSRRHCPTARETVLRVFCGDRETLNAIAVSLRRLATPPAETMATSIDYVLACLGERGSMSRVSERLSALCKLAETGQFSISEATLVDLRVAADTWRRLSMATLEDWQNGYTAFQGRFEVYSFDLARPWELEKKLSGISMRPMPPELAKAARAAVPRWSRRFMSSHAAGWPGQKASKVPFPLSVPTVAEDTAALDAAEAAEARAGSSLVTEREPVYVSVLDRIAPDGGQHGADVVYAPLLQPVPLIPAIDPDELYDRLQKEFPWMHVANEKAAYAAALGGRSPERGFRIPPLVLIGPPGAGKSRWARRLAQIAGVPLHPSSLAGLASSKAVVGSERGWASARPSLPALALFSTKVANPFILVDEFDKSSPSQNNGDALMAFLPMLEKETARSYPDAYLLGSLDISRVSFVFTANSIGGTPQPFLDRVEIINVSKPSIKDYPAVAAALVAEAIADHGLQEMEGKDGLAAAAVLDAIRCFEQGGSIRMADAEARKRISKEVWSPKKPKGLKLVE